MNSFWSQQQKSRVQFNKQAHFYADSLHFSKGKTLGIMDGYIQSIQPKTVLDVATGAGFTALAAAHSAQTVIGIDIAEKLLDLAVIAAKREALKNVTFALGSAEQMPIRSGTVDLVSCRIAAHHFANISSFLAECARVCSPSGALAFTDTISAEDPVAARFLNTVEMARDPSHVWCQSASWWQTQIQNAGFRIRTQTIANNAEMTLSSWAERGGVSVAQLLALIHHFETAPPEAIDAYNIRKIDQEFYFYWPTFSCLAELDI